MEVSLIHRKKATIKKPHTSDCALLTNYSLKFQKYLGSLGIKVFPNLHEMCTLTSLPHSLMFLSRRGPGAAVQDSLRFPANQFLYLN